VTTLADAPARVGGVQLHGEAEGSGYRTPPALVRRGDGQALQLTPLLYLVLDAVDGRRTCAEIATVVSRRMRRGISADMVARLVDEHLRPMGLLTLADGSDPPLKRSNPLLGLTLKFTVTDPGITRRLTDPFRPLFRAVPVTLVVLGFLAVTWWVFFERGLAPAAYDAFQRPQLLLLVFAVTVLSGGFHEFGHAAAARFSGAEPGSMGAGLYLVWPAFYTDVTDSYRLGRRGRIRTDLGGLYFNALVVVLTFGWWYATRWDALLLLVATQVLQMVQQLLPLLRFDGYHLLADLAGVPDLYQRIRPTLLGLLPHRWSDPSNRLLKPGARAVIALWVLVTVPMMGLMLLALVAAVPRLLGTAWSVVHEDAAGVAAAWRGGGPVDLAAHTLQVLAVVLPVIACALILGRIGLRWFRGLARWSRGSGLKRITAAVLSAFLVTGLAWAWWPYPGNYRPILPGEQNLFTSVLPTARSAPAAPPRELDGAAVLRRDRSLPVGTAAERRLAAGAPLQATFPGGQALPTRSDPQLAMVLVPSEEQAPAPTPSGPGPSATPDTPDESWVFPFDQPLPPEEGDNQAAAYNTTDGSLTYDVAFALVWAEGDEVLNVNEAHAYASCSECVTVAVAFQVVLIMDDAQVVVPQNLAVAANYECYRCITAAIANQLVLSVQDQPGEEQLLALAEVWGRLTDFGQDITAYSLAEIAAQLDGFTADIMAILGVAQPEPVGTSQTSTPSPGETSGPSSSSGPSPTDSPGTTQTPEPAPSPSSSPSPGTATPTEPAPTTAPTTESATATPTEEPSPTATTPTPTSTP